MNHGNAHRKTFMVYKDRPTFYPWNGFEVSFCYFSTSNLQETLLGISIFLIPKSLMSKVILLEVRVFRAMKKRSPVIVVSGTHLEQTVNLLL